MAFNQTVNRHSADTLTAFLTAPLFGQNVSTANLHTGFKQDG
jgi:hypothetical protein